MASEEDMYLYLDVSKSIGASDLYLAEYESPDLYVEKANPNRDPALGLYISGGLGKGSKGKGTDDLSELVDSLMDKLPGEELDKDEQ